MIGGWGFCERCKKGLMRTKRVGFLAIRVKCDFCGFDDLIEKPVGWKHSYFLKEHEKRK